MLSSSPWVGSMHHRCRPFPVWMNGLGGFPALLVTRGNIGDQRHMQIRPCLSLVHPYAISWGCFYLLLIRDPG